jgi:hypothetical protein
MKFKEFHKPDVLTDFGRRNAVRRGIKGRRGIPKWGSNGNV